MRLSFGTLGRQYINQIETIHYRAERFNDYNLRRNRQADESQCDTNMKNIFARPIKTPDSWHTFLDLITKIVICFWLKRINTGAKPNGVLAQREWNVGLASYFIILEITPFKMYWYISDLSPNIFKPFFTLIFSTCMSKAIKFAKENYFWRPSQFWPLMHVLFFFLFFFDKEVHGFKYEP